QPRFEVGGLFRCGGGLSEGLGDPGRAEGTHRLSLSPSVCAGQELRTGQVRQASLRRASNAPEAITSTPAAIICCAQPGSVSSSSGRCARCKAPWCVVPRYGWAAPALRPSLGVLSSCWVVCWVTSSLCA